MFEQFSPTNKDSWKNQIEKDLKGKPYSELIWHLNNELNFEPFYTKEEIGQTSPLASGSGNNWHISEQITVVDCRKANATALEVPMPLKSTSAKSFLQPTWQPFLTGLNSRLSPFISI